MKQIIRCLWLLKALLFGPIGLFVFMIGILTWPIIWGVHYVKTGKALMEEEPWFIKVADWCVRIKYEQ